MRQAGLRGTQPASQTNARLYRAYILKEQLRALYHLHDPTLAEAHLDAWLAWAQRSKLKPFVRLARTLRRYRDGILAAITLGLSNARLEGLHSKVRLLSHRSFGFHSAAPSSPSSTSAAPASPSTRPCDDPLKHEKRRFWDGRLFGSGLPNRRRRSWVVPRCVADKQRIVLSVLRGEASVAEAARRNKCSETSIAKWRDQFVQGGIQALEAGAARGPSARETQLDQVTSALGEAHVELRLLKREGAGFASRSWR